MSHPDKYIRTVHIVYGISSGFFTYFLLKNIFFKQMLCPTSQETLFKKLDISKKYTYVLYTYILSKYHELTRQGFKKFSFETSEHFFRFSQKKINSNFFNVPIHFIFVKLKILNINKLWKIPK